MLKVKKIYKNFGKLEVIKGLTFEVKKGDVVGLLGPNGAGKTTTMRMISSYYFPAKGEIWVNKYDTQKDTLKSQQEIGYMPENNPLYLDMMVYDYLVMTGKFYGVPKKKLEKRIIEVSKSVGIRDRLTSNIKELSKGYKQRVGLASTLLHDPKLLILDEPTEGLDPNQREEIRHLIKKLSKEKVILISTHVMQEVKAMCNKVIVINDGELVVEGEPDSLTGKKQLELHIQGKNVTKELKSLVDKGDEIDVLETYNIGDNEVKKVLIKTNKEIRPELTKLASKNNWVVWQLSMQDALEEVFEDLK